MQKPLTKTEMIALWINDHVGTIEFAIFCLILVTVPIAAPRTQTVIFYISSGYLQLVLLPMILLGGNIQSRRMEEIEEERYKHMLGLEERILTAMKNESKSKGA